MRVKKSTVGYVFSLMTGFAAIAIVPSEAVAEETMARAKAAYEEGKQLFESGKFEEAIDKFTESYNLTTEPNLLFNLAASAERLGDADRAIAYYEVYLEEIPDAADADKVRQRIELLKSGEYQPPSDDLKADTAPPRKEPASTQPGPDKTEAPKALSAEEFYETETGKNKNENPIWPPLTIGLGGMLLGGGVVTAVLAHKEYTALEGACSPSCTDDDISTARGLAIAADVQFGVGAAAVAAGLIGMVVLKKKARESQTAVKIVPGGIMLEGSF